MTEEEKSCVIMTPGLNLAKKFAWSSHSTTYDAKTGAALVETGRRVVIE
jgi:hypothetical protein